MRTIKKGDSRWNQIYQYGFYDPIKGKRTYTNPNAKEYKWESFISEAEKNLLINEAQKSIDPLQDEVDEYNAITKISIDF